MIMNPSPINVARSALSVLVRRKGWLFLPFLLMVITNLAKDYFAWVYPTVDPFNWVMFGLPFEILLAPVEVLIFYLLLAEEGDKPPSFPPAYRKKSLYYLWYSFILKGIEWVVIGVLLAGVFAAISLVMGGEFSSDNSVVRWVIIGVVIPPLVWLGVRLLLTPVAVADGRKSPLRLSFQLTRKKSLSLLLSFAVLLAPPIALLLGLEWALETVVPGMKEGSEPLAWMLVQSLLTTSLDLVFISFLSIWYTTLKPVMPVVSVE